MMIRMHRKLAKESTQITFKGRKRLRAFFIKFRCVSLSFLTEKTKTFSTLNCFQQKPPCLDQAFAEGEALKTICSNIIDTDE
ncbi:MAG: hypothetical protein CM15mP130_2750 [Verrucomicrobiota bacterium]|nr:MAG: hypothetical protein CM15mP130_2750 [Verrucomicrobiota bacterium]